ncbi:MULTISPECIES: DEAD/DEAH box helicase [Lactobacillus]|uniref:DUF3427 domain-containing protein n=1 Tax=Lactobacillus xujianguonis TaxID=2495899 RepID=A0A437SXB5_9LACO|nr:MULTISPECIES: DEAD/DEAH box helicase [Lactobacillus]RVU71552.1 DUF3427 domain-containing protein [Lactobacillus xujianguonis]
MNDTLKDAILNSLYDQAYPGHELLGPQLLTNTADDKIWLTLRRELLTCKSFTWGVAFITPDMLVPFKLVMAELAQKGVKGTLITGTYLGFNQPRVFTELRKIPNLAIRIVQENGFHVKGYLFDHGTYETAIIGSANFTRSALLSNTEWSMKLSSTKQGEFVAQIKRQLASLEAQSSPLTKEWLHNYAANWQQLTATSKSKAVSSEKITPNAMQQAALKNLTALVKAGAKRGLIVSATGTGKTYLGAFAVKQFKPRRFLYVVHRRQIAQKSLESFYRVIGGDRSNYGILAGDQHDTACQYLFATVQTLSQPQVLAQFDPADFDYILIDEAHRATAPSYQKILNYFQPQFLLGMTATPERMDEGNVYQIFDYHLAYEIRLRDALEEKMLTPFHYVGVQDYEADGQVIDETSALRYLTAKKRVAYILKELAYYGYSGEKVQGLVFCSRQEEARSLAQQFTEQGHPAVALTNEDSFKKRQAAIADLQAGKLEYLITVDLFNEGVDIPSLNQIVMLRNTQSSIVFIQQLGRGLRKYPGKSFVTVLDFIGNYRNNFLIPIALNHDVSRDVDRVRRETMLPSLIGLSTINFSKIAAEKILTSLDKIKLDGLKELRKSYRELKEKIGRVPLLQDFADYGSTSPLVFAQNHSLPNYGTFLQKMGEQITLTASQKGMLTFVIKELLNGKRPHELVLLQLLLAQGRVSSAEYIAALKEHGAYVNEQVLQSVREILSLSFFEVKSGKTTKKAQYGGATLITFTQNDYALSPILQQNLTNSEFKKLLQDAIVTGLKMTQAYRGDQQFTLYEQYDREDVCRLLNWPLDVSAPMYGYRVGETETPIFITYQKNDEEKRNAVYDNRLINGRSLRWYTRSPRHLDSDEVQRLLAQQMKLHLFVKRSDAAGKQFFYLGEAKIVPESVKEEQIGPKKKAAVGMDLLLLKPLTVTMNDLLFGE